MASAKRGQVHHYRWTSYRLNALGQLNPILTPHALYLAPGKDEAQRLRAYRAFFRAQLDKSAIDDIRLALNQDQPLGNSRFYDRIEHVTGQRREAKPRGRPKLKLEEPTLADGQKEEPRP